MGNTRRHVVLAGAGHAHLHVARAASAFASLGISLTLVDPGEFWYSGIATGLLGGMYRIDDCRVDPRPLIERAGGRFVRGRVVGLDRGAGQALLEDGTRLQYDALSFNVGSETAVPADLGTSPPAWTVKPIVRLWELRRTLERRLRQPKIGGPLQVVVVGGGATGCEIAAAIDSLARRSGSSIGLTLITSASRLLPEAPRPAAHRLAAALGRRGIRLQFDQRVVKLEDGLVHTADGKSILCDEAVLATGLRSPALMGRLTLPVGPEGGLLVDEFLRSPVDSRIFGVGDCISLRDRPLPRLGVYAVRAAPVLRHNLLSAFTGDALKRFVPQKRSLAILNLGEGDALLLWGPLHWRGRISLWLKDRIDRRFLKRYRARP